MKKFLLALFLGLTALQAKAVVIEGTTPSGKFRTVFVTEQGRLPVAIDTTTLQHVIVDTGTVTVVQAAGTVFIVKNQGGLAIQVSASTATQTITNQGTSTIAESVGLPADPDRQDGLFCNNEDIFGETTIIYIGGAGVTTLSGQPIRSGSCYSPDNPPRFIGDLHAVSTATAHWSYIYHK